MGNLICRDDYSVVDNKMDQLTKDNIQLTEQLIKLSELLDFEQLDNINLRKELELANKEEECKQKEQDNRSKLNVEEFVDDMLKDVDVNIKGLPDFIEKKIYTNVLTILIGILSKVLTTTSVEVLNHKIKFDIVPKEN